MDYRLVAARGQGGWAAGGKWACLQEVTAGDPVFLAVVEMFCVSSASMSMPGLCCCIMVWWDVTIGRKLGKGSFQQQQHKTE